MVAASRKVRALEEEFSVQLVDRQGQEVVLTKDGRLLVEMAEPMVESFLSLRSVFDDRKGKVPRKLTVAAPAGVLTDALPEPVDRYRRKFPNVGLRLMERPSRGALAALLAGQADIAIIGMTDSDEAPTSLTLHRLARYPIYLLCPAGHELATEKRLTVRQIARHPLVLSSEDTSDRAQVDLTFAGAGVLANINVAISASRVPLISRYVSMGFGVALLAPGDLKSPVRVRARSALVWRDVSSLFGYEDLFLLQRSGRFELPHVRVFRELVMAEFAGR